MGLGHDASPVSSFSPSFVFLCLCLCLSSSPSAGKKIGTLSDVGGRGLRIKMNLSLLSRFWSLALQESEESWKHKTTNLSLLFKEGNPRGVHTTESLGSSCNHRCCEGKHPSHNVMVFPSTHGCKLTCKATSLVHVSSSDDLWYCL